MNRTLNSLFGTMDGQSLQTGLQTLYIDLIQQRDAALISHHEFIGAVSQTRFLKNCNVLTDDVWYQCKDGDDYVITFHEAVRKIAEALGWNDARKQKKQTQIADVCYYECPSTTVSTKVLTDAIVESGLFGAALLTEYQNPRGKRLPFLVHPLFREYVPAAISGRQLLRLFIDFWNFSSFLLSVDKLFSKLQRRDRSENAEDGLGADDVKFNHFIRKFLEICPPEHSFWGTPNGQRWQLEADTISDSSQGAEMTVAVITWETVYAAILATMPQVMAQGELAYNQDAVIGAELGLECVGAPRVGATVEIATDLAEGAAVAGAIVSAEPVIATLASDAKTLGTQVLNSVKTAYKGSSSAATVTVTGNLAAKAPAVATAATTTADGVSSASLVPSGAISVGASANALTQRIPPPSALAAVSYAKQYNRSRPQRILDSHKSEQ